MLTVAATWINRSTTNHPLKRCGGTHPSKYAPQELLAYEAQLLLEPLPAARRSASRYAASAMSAIRLSVCGLMFFSGNYSGRKVGQPLEFGYSERNFILKG